MEHCHRQLPACMLTRAEEHFADDVVNTFTYWQALGWIEEKQIFLKIFIDLLKLYPKLIQEKAYDTLWNFILPLLPNSVSGLAQLDTVSPLHVQISSPATSPESATCIDSFLISTNQEAKDIKNETLQPTTVKVSDTVFKKKVQFRKKKKSTKISKIPSVFVSSAASHLESKRLPRENTLYSSKVFVCRDPNNVKDIISSAVLGSVSAVTFLHCMVPTLQSTNNIITECNAFIFIFNDSTISSSECLSQLKQALDYHLPIIFVRYPDFQLPCNMKEIITKCCESTDNLNQYLSVRRRSFVISNSLKNNPNLSDIGCLSGREMTSTSPLLKHSKNNKKSLFISTNKKSEIFQKTVQNVINALQNGYKQSHLYSYKLHVSCISQIIDSIARVLKAPISYDTAYFQQTKKYPCKKTSLHSKITSPMNKKIEKPKNIAKEKPTDDCSQVPQFPNVNPKARWSVIQKNNDNATALSSSTSIEMEKNMHQTPNTSIHNNRCNNPYGHPSTDSSQGKETSFIIFPKSSSQLNQKPIVVKWPPPWNGLDLENVKNVLRDETESQISSNFVDLDLTKEFNPYSEDDFI
ncbi:uncharacterized protein LOC118765432 [Octopus sinensis]|nr:uncharacterized protein LOC118765432 [Octopus sinensis]